MVGGTSAGMAALPEIMTMFQDRQSAQKPATAVAAHGLGLFNGAIVEQHFDGKGGRLERFTGLLRNSAELDVLSARPGSGAKMIGLAVEERTGLVVQGNRLTVVGLGNAHVFLKSSTGRTLVWHHMAPGESNELTRDAQGIPTLERD